MDFTGKITHIGKIQEVGEKKYKKRVFVVEEANEEYPNSCCFTLFGEQKVGIVSKMKVGYEVIVSANLKCSEYKGKFFTNINAWMVKKVKQEEPDCEKDDNLPF